ncbi:MAG: hypothetical protein PVG92_07405, partial [Holophagae bacterium]
MAFTVLAAVLVGVGAVPWIEGLSASIAVAAAFVPTGWWGGGGVRRRLAEASLLPAAFALTMVGGAIMRRMLLPPLLLLAIWAVAAAAWDRVPADRRPVLAALMGLAARAAVGLGLAGFSALEVVLALAVSAVLPWMALKRWGRRAAENAALFGAVLPWQSWPLAAGAVVCLSIALGVVGAGRNRDDLARRWIPGLGAVA